jgi:putative beta-lysine N-acetyltransferase
MAIANRKPFHSLCPGYRSEERNFGGACSDKGVQNIHRSFWDEFFDKTDTQYRNPLYIVDTIITTGNNMFGPLRDQKNNLSYTGAETAPVRHAAKNIPVQRQRQTQRHTDKGAYADAVSTLGKSLVHHGPYNDRAYLFRLNPADLPEISGRLLALARGRGYSRVIARVPAPARNHFASRGYTPGAYIPRLYRGAVDGYYMVNYRNPPESDWRDGIDDVLAVAREKAQGSAASQVLEPGFTCTPAAPADAPALAAIYRKVFLTYPVPVHDPAYLVRGMQSNLLRCFCIRKDGRIAAVAAAAVDPDGRFAEMTGFATLPEYRGHRFAGCLLWRIETEMRSIGVKTVFAIVRARSYPANTTFARAGYTHTGTLAGCVNICGSLEDMSVWYRSLDDGKAVSP